jgi:hypothetical protein
MAKHLSSNELWCYSWLVSWAHIGFFHSVNYILDSGTGIKKAKKRTGRSKSPETGLAGTKEVVTGLIANDVVSEKRAVPATFRRLGKSIKDNKMVPEDIPLLIEWLKDCQAGWMKEKPAINLISYKLDSWLYQARKMQEKQDAMSEDWEKYSL